MSASNLELADQDKRLAVSCTLRLDADSKEAVLRFAARNTSREALVVFHERTPFVRITKSADVFFMSLMPPQVPWMKVLVPHIPPVQKLEPGAELAGEARYPLPLRSTHPYPAEPVTQAPIPTEPALARSVSCVFGFFPEGDGNTLFPGVEKGDQIPSYYELKRQFLAASPPQQAPITVLRPR